MRISLGSLLLLVRVCDRAIRLQSDKKGIFVSKDAYNQALLLSLFSYELE